MRARVAAAVASHTCLPPPVSVIIVKLSEFRVQTATRVDKGVSAVLERMRVLVAIQAMSSIFAESGATGGGRKKGAPEGRVVGFKRCANCEYLCVVMIF